MMSIVDSYVSRLRTQTQKEKGNLKYKKRYSREEKDAIKFMTEKGSTDEEIARHLKRSVKGVTQQRQKLISVENPELVKQLVSNYTPSNPDPSFIIPQHKNV
jgi:intergrase/recombinase